MSDWIMQFDFFLIGAMLVLVAMGLGAAIIMPGLDRWSRRFFIALFSVLVLYIAVGLVDVALYEQPGMARPEIVVVFFESLLISIPIPMFTVYLLHSCGEEYRGSALFLAAIVLWLVFFLLVLIAQFTSFIYVITPDNHFYIGPWFPLLVAPMDVLMLLNLAAVFRRRKKLSRKKLLAFLFYLIPLTAAILFHTFFYTILLVVIGVAFSALSMYCVILQEQIEQYMRQQREIAHQQARILVLQMRPHFIYNTMTSIYYLCDRDPQKAKQVTLDFTTYLRKIFAAVASEQPIPFSEELEHTRAYLAVEQARFEGSLFVDYDTQHTRFSLPPLTLQPIVENAVKHGLDPDSDPLRISVRTRETESGSEITVEDNGSGFAPIDDSKPHVALANIRQRLEMMCGGKLELRSGPEGGTTVKVTIPRAGTRR